MPISDCHTSYAATCTKFVRNYTCKEGAREELWVLVGAQLTEWSLPTPEDPGLNPGISRYISLLIVGNKIQIKRSREHPILE